MKPKLFIPHLPVRFDPIENRALPTVSTAPAVAMGDTVVINRLPIAPSVSEFEAAQREIVKRIAAEFDPKNDFVVMMGDAILFAAAVSAACLLTGAGPIKTLRWDRDARRYDLFEVDVWN